jgi:hypothetical protein
MITPDQFFELSSLIEKAQAFADILQLDFVSIRLSEALDALNVAVNGDANSPISN